MRRRARRTVTFGINAVVVFLCAACGGGVSPSSPTPLSATWSAATLGASAAVAPSIAVVDGTVIAPPTFTAVDEFPLSGVLVEVLEAEADVVIARATSDDRGTYHFELRPGVIRLRGSKPGYSGATGPRQTIEGGVRTITGLRIDPRPTTREPVSPQPLNITGVVRDARGSPVQAALVLVTDATGLVGFDGGSTNEGGRFEIRLRPRAEPATYVLKVEKPGYPTQRVPFPCCTDSDPTVLNVQMPRRVTSVTLNGPATLTVRVPVQITADILFEDGARMTVTPTLFERAGAVENSRSGPGMVEGRVPGGGAIWWGYQNVGAGLTFTVTP
jgi:hypothetical protein